LPLDALLRKFGVEAVVNAVNKFDEKHAIEFLVRAVLELEAGIK
jgi:hypothetical protein